MICQMSARRSNPTSSSRPTCLSPVCIQIFKGNCSSKFWLQIASKIFSLFSPRPISRPMETANAGRLLQIMEYNFTNWYSRLSPAMDVERSPRGQLGLILHMNVKWDNSPCYKCSSVLTKEIIRISYYTILSYRILQRNYSRSLSVEENSRCFDLILEAAGKITSLLEDAVVYYEARYFPMIWYGGVTPPNIDALILTYWKRLGCLYRDDGSMHPFSQSFLGQSSSRTTLTKITLQFTWTEGIRTVSHIGSLDPKTLSSCPGPIRGNLSTITVSKIELRAQCTDCSTWCSNRHAN